MGLFRGLEKIATNNILNGRRLKNNGDGNIMRGTGGRDGYAKGQGAGMIELVDQEGMHSNQRGINAKGVRGFDR